MLGCFKTQCISIKNANCVRKKKNPDDKMNNIDKNWYPFGHSVLLIETGLV